MSILEVENIGIAFGGLRALDRVGFEVAEGEIFAVIGPNGAGKTTLFNIVSGLYRPGEGRVRLLGQDVTGIEPHLLAEKGLSRTFQNLQLFGRMTALENVMVGRHLRESRGILRHLFLRRAVEHEERESRARARDLLAFVGLDRLADQPANALPYGAAKRLEIARALASEPRILLLDEPAAGCNPAETGEIEALIREIARRGVTVVLVEHDMRLVMRLSHRIHVLNHGRTLAEGAPAEIRLNPAVIEAYLGHHGAKEAARAVA
ncbi:ABC transporter ATP-binding protein [Benzoatithermus flavus]|uniref:ABC transporter ATP-binding protein n=1 Tax=Benzoatithermus flavus TaxID=3108223 RepID=A0ABU8XUI7_9PROT